MKRLADGTTVCRTQGNSRWKNLPSPDRRELSHNHRQSQLERQKDPRVIGIDNFLSAPLAVLNFDVLFVSGFGFAIYGLPPSVPAPGLTSTLSATR